jgi:phage FluMu protein Com
MTIEINPMATIRCTNCNTQLTAQQAGKPCPRCGSLDRNLSDNDLAMVTEKARSVRKQPRAITQIKVAGFKSIAEEARIEIRPLTILAGANSSGKSSMMQPLLLLKQTLEASFDPGSIMLNGPLVKFTSADQVLSRIGKGHSSGNFQVGIWLSNGDSFQTTFRKENKMGFGIEQLELDSAKRHFTLWPDMTQAEIVKTGITLGKDFSDEKPEGYKQGKWEIMRDRCFLEPAWVAKGPNGTSFFASERPGPAWEGIISEVIHLPGLRGNPERAYPMTAVGTNYSGVFQTYTASIISEWMGESEATLAKLNADLKKLKLTGGVEAHRINDVQIELHVGRLPDAHPTKPEDRVNIVDVGVGVSQTLPVLVALHAARPGTLVYVEQPETHLHPQAQFDLAQILANAAKRGVRVVVETHSTILLLGVQAPVAEGHLEPDLVKLHWFQRDKQGRSAVRSGELEEAGAFGDWPQDFDDVTLTAQKKYLDAASQRIFAR